MLTLLAITNHVIAGSDIAWPQVPVPEQVEVFEVGKEMIANGMPIKVQGFVSHATPVQVAASMRQLLRPPLVEDQRGNTIILGRSQGQHYITVQLAPLGSGTRALIAMTRPSERRRVPAGTVADEHLLTALPPGSALVNHTSSVDGPTRAEQTAIMNFHSIDVNSQYIKRMLHSEGFNLEREARPMHDPSGHMSASPDTRTMFFKRAGIEAVAVITRDDSGRSVVVLNRVSFAERIK